MQIRMLAYGVNMKTRREKDFVSFFDEKTGRYVRTGIIKDNRDTGEDVFKASFPELLDIGIMGHCIHGSSGLCIKAGVQCYQDGLHSERPNMTLEDFASVVEQCKGETYQFALGGCGDPDQHEQFEKILELCRQAGIVPNFTTSGLGMTPELAKLCKKYCGAVAVSWYRSDYTLRSIRLLLQEGVKTNVHYVLSKSSVREAIQLLTGDGFPNGINAVVFLLHKPVGLGTQEELITKENEDFHEFLELIDGKEFPYRIGFDSCIVPALIFRESTDKRCLDTCEGARFSAYISADMQMMPCSFDNQQKRWSVDLHKHSIREAWNSAEFDRFRKQLQTACPQCSRRKECMGGCPICPEIILCREKG